MPDVHPDAACPNCGGVLIEGKRYCPNCGLAILSPESRVAIDLYIQDRIKGELSARLREQNGLVREIGDKAEDIVWGRLKRLGWVVSVFALFLALLGVKTVDDAGKKIVDGARQRVEPLIQNAENRAKSAEGEIDKTAGKLKSLNGLADEQTKAVAGLNTRVAMALGKLSEYETRMKGYEGRVTNSGEIALKEIADLRATVAKQQQNLNETGGLVRELKGQVLDFGNRDVSARMFVASSGLPGFWQMGKTGCDPLLPGSTVGFCVDGTPLLLIQNMPGGKRRPVASLSSVGFQDVSGSPKPICGPESRGLFYVEKRSDNKADAAFVCVREADNTYAWTSLMPTP